MERGPRLHVAGGRGRQWEVQTGQIGDGSRLGSAAVPPPPPSFLYFQTLPRKKKSF